MTHLDNNKQNIQLYVPKYKKLYPLLTDISDKQTIRFVRQTVLQAYANGNYRRDSQKEETILRTIDASFVLINEIELRRSALAAFWLYYALSENDITEELIVQNVGSDTLLIAQGLIKIREIYAKNPAIESENFSSLLLNLAQDARVILIMLGERLSYLRWLKDANNEAHRLIVAQEVSTLYAPLAHRLGLYRVKTEMEDLFLKYTNRPFYDDIARKLKETKRERDLFIDEFIAPIKQQVDKIGIDYEIKGRTKSIHSIYNKIIKQQIEFDKIFDLFAIRLVLDVPLEQEKTASWQVFSIITDMYQPNPKRMRDWISIPKTNGYESLHITVLSTEKKWVEVQIRTKRMDEIAEKGLAAHWRYKGGKSSNTGMDEWLKHVRELLERDKSSVTEVLNDLKPAFIDEEIYIFTPKGDLHRLPAGATLLDFAFQIHSDLGSKCTGGRINGKNTTIKQTLKSGDQVEIITTSTQRPKLDWLSFVTTSKARTRIKHAIKELENKEADYGKELLNRRLKNKKLDFDESTFMRLIKKLGYKTITEFFVDIASEKREVNSAIEQYVALLNKDAESSIHEATPITNSSFKPSIHTDNESIDTLVIGENLKGIDYKLAKCCTPIYGDEIFGFVSSQGGIRIHRSSCPNALNMKDRFKYRIVNACWAGKADSQYTVTLLVVGQDSTTIATKITSIINKEKNVALRSITLDSHSGLFNGTLTIMIQDKTALLNVIKNLKSIKGIKKVERIGMAGE